MLVTVLLGVWCPGVLPCSDAAPLLQWHSANRARVFPECVFVPPLPHSTGRKQNACVQVGHRLLRDCCFIHLDSDSDKFMLLMEMLHKLYALVNKQCCEDNPDTLTHHEILLPGQLLQKFFKEKVEVALSDLAEQVCHIAWLLLKSLATK